MSPHRAQSSGATQAAPAPPQAPWAPGDAEWRPGGEDQALKSEEGVIEGTGCVHRHCNRQHTTNHRDVDVWQLMLASAGAVLAVGGLLLGVAHALMLLRARRQAVRQARYAELRELSPAPSDSEVEPLGRRGVVLEARSASRTSSSGGSADALL